MAKKWLNNTIYPLAAIGKYPQIIVSRIIFDNRNGVSMEFCRILSNDNSLVIQLTKQQARMLIRRLQQCLNDGSI